MDYARHNMRHQNDSKKADYVEKIGRKYTLTGKISKNFAERISLYNIAFQSTMKKNQISLNNQPRCFLILLMEIPVM